MSWSQIAAADVQPQRWKNAGGWTRELLAWPHASDWLLRISVADIEQDGPFSAFDGVQRWIAVLQGPGIRLYEYELFPGDEPLSFDGALAPDCSLIDGPTRDFNLMHRRGHGRLELLTAAQPLPAGPADWLALFSAEGGTLRHGCRAMRLAPQSLAWCEQPAEQPLQFEGQGAAWWLRWCRTDVEARP
ncbi:HutD family protein [Roseateles sp.]|jgi:environmental stress-induced protein Ves|uniref:HutD family protein n=1 Tax=Roseateles sp. TaxID=1971397 RepID=UPI0037C4F3A3